MGGALLTIREAAMRLGVPMAALRAVAELHGFLVYIGRAVRIEEDALPELVKLCRNAPKAPASTSGLGRATSFATPADPTFRPAQATAAKLIALSPDTSRRATARPGRPNPAT